MNLNNQFDFTGPIPKYDAAKDPQTKGKRFDSFFMKPEEARRLVLLSNNDHVFTGYIHNLFAVSKSKGLNLPISEMMTICPTKNGIPEYKGMKCPLCEVKGKSDFKGSEGKDTFLSFARNVVITPVLDLGSLDNPGDPMNSRVSGHKSKDKVYQFQLRYLVLSLPTKKSAGTVATLSTLAASCKKNLIGLVVNVTRTGASADNIGDKWMPHQEATGDDSFRIARIALGSDDETRKRAVINYIKANPETYGVIADDDTRFKYLNISPITSGDLPLYSPSELARRYRLDDPNVQGGQAPAESNDDSPFGSEEDIPF